MGCIKLDILENHYKTPELKIVYAKKELTSKKSSSEERNYYHARYFDPRISIFYGVDPLAEKYPGMSGFTYCANNPVILVDPDGMDVETADEQSRENIKNTLTKEEAKYVKFNKKGQLNTRKLNKSKSTSENITALKELANSETTYIFSTQEEYTDGKGETEELTDNPSKGAVGVTLIPGASEDPSPDNNVHVITSSKLSKEKQASNTAHEGYGHAYFYELRKQGDGVSPNPFHKYKYEFKYGPEEWYEPARTFIPSLIAIRRETNTKLGKQIKIVEQQAINNFRSRKK